MYSGAERPWHEVRDAAVEPAATPGYARFDVTLDRHVPGPAERDRDRDSIQVVPFIHLAQGGRLFDHNRNAGRHSRTTR